MTEHDPETQKAWIAKHKETGEYHTATISFDSRLKCEMKVTLVFCYQKRIDEFEIVELEITEVQR